MSRFRASQQHQTESEPAVSVTSQCMAEGRCRLGEVEELEQPGLGLLQQEMGEVPAKERSKEVKAGRCHPCCVAGKAGTAQYEWKEKGQGLSG